MLDHLLSLEAMLDISILTGFSFGIAKADFLAIMGELLGDFVGRHGRWPNGARTQAIRDFPAIKTKQQLQQFLGCCNWVRIYLPQYYPGLVKMIGHYLRPEAMFPPAGLGSGMTQDDKIIYAIKKCVEYYITIAVLDEVAAMDGTWPLELLADCSGIAWGGTAYQMVRDLSHFKVLLTAG